MQAAERKRLWQKYGAVLNRVVPEIAAELGLSPKAAESVLTRARLAFRDAFTALAQSDPRWSSG